MQRRDFLTLSGRAALGLAAMSALPRSASAQQTIPLWFNTPFHGGDAKAMEMIVKKFNEDQKAMRIDLTQGGWTEYYAQLYNAVVAGVAPNIGICHDFRFISTAPALYPLAETPIGNVLDMLKLGEADFVAPAWKLPQVNGVQYGIPLDQSAIGFYYNRTIFKAAGLDPDNPPKTRAEFENACEAIKKTGKIAFNPAFNSAPRWIRRAFFMLLWSGEGQLIDGNKAAFNTPHGLESLKYLVDMVGARGWNKPGTDANKQFLAGELGMCFNGTWFYLTVAESNIDYGSGVMPTFYKKPATWSSAHNLVLPKQPAGKANEDRLRAAANALKLISDNSFLWGQYGGHVPVRKIAAEDERLRASDTWKKTLQHFAAMSREGVMRIEPQHPKIVEFDDAIEPFIQQAYNGTMPPKDALDKAEAAANNALKG